MYFDTASYFGMPLTIIFVCVCVSVQVCKHQANPAVSAPQPALRGVRQKELEEAQPITKSVWWLNMGTFPNASSNKRSGSI